LPDVLDCLEGSLFFGCFVNLTLCRKQQACPPGGDFSSSYLLCIGRSPARLNFFLYGAAFLLYFSCPDEFFFFSSFSSVFLACVPAFLLIKVWPSLLPQSPVTDEVIGYILVHPFCCFGKSSLTFFFYYFPLLEMLFSYNHPINPGDSVP